MSNDPRKNINNLLFKPNNSIDDEQPAFYFYSQPEATSTTNNANATTANIPQNIAGPNNNPYQHPNVNQPNLFDTSFFDNYPRQNITQTHQFPTVPSNSVQTAHLFPVERKEAEGRGSEPLPPVILFSNTNTVPKTARTEQAFTISTYSTIGTPANPIVNETPPSIPLLSINQSKKQHTSYSVPSETTLPNLTVVEGAKQVPLFNSSAFSTKGLVESFGTPNKLTQAELSVPLYPTTGITPGQSLFPSNRASPVPPATVPLFSPGELPVKSTLAAPPLTGSTNTYRRTGSKRPVYAPIPGLQNHQSPTSQTLGSAGDYFTSSQPTAHKIYTANKPTSQPVDSSQGNSPFLCPVSIPTVLGEGFIQNQSVIMPATGDSQIPIMSTGTYQDEGRLSPGVSSTSIAYKPPNYHWFYKKEIDGKVTWEPFSVNDSAKLENSFTSHDLSPEQNIPTDGGRYDVNILRRQRTSVYWESKPSEVRRCAWFHKSHTDSKRIPFEENVATQLEEEYKSAVESNQWGRKVVLPSGEIVMFHTHEVLILSSNSQMPDMAGGNMQEAHFRHRIIKRGIDGYVVEEGESDKVDHLLFMVHGIGAGCDLKFRAVEDVVDDFRSVALQLISTHYRSSCDEKLVTRVEILPIGWHSKLHSEDTGIDNKLKSITLESIPKLREFTNDTLLDILFYSSPIYGQTIISSVGSELNRIYDLFKQRNPNFTGGVSLAGHSLGSLILFDVLCNQVPAPPTVEQDSDDGGAAKNKGQKPSPMSRKMSRRISYMVGSCGTGQAQVNYPKLNFQPAIFFALGSPIGMFVTIRGLDNLGEKFELPTCPGFFNIFHPYDPVAYRIESLINHQLASVKPVLIPHHKGRKRMHLELKETMAKVGSDLKQKLMDSMKNTWNSLLGWSNTKPPVQPAIAEEVDKVLEQFATKHSSTQNEGDENSGNAEVGDMNLGMLNKGRRIDYVLQEAPVEFFNEYIFALSSHVCYWDSEDTVLMIIKEIYNLLNVSPDSQIPQQSMTIERPPSQPRTIDQFTIQTVQLGMDPTVPIKMDCDIGPPPLSGFVKQ